MLVAKPTIAKPQRQAMLDSIGQWADAVPPLHESGTFGYGYGRALAEKKKKKETKSAKVW